MFATIYNDKRIAAYGGDGDKTHVEYKKTSGKWFRTIHGPNRFKEVVEVPQTEVDAFLGTIKVFYRGAIVQDVPFPPEKQPFFV